jgi:fucose permease
MFVFGIVMALLGAVMPVVSGRLAFGLADIGTLFLVMNAAMLAASLLVAPAADRLGTGGPVVLGAGLVALALLAVARASRFGDLLPAVGCLGFGGGALNATTNILVADLHDDPESKASALNLLGMFYGFGALLLPFAIGALLSTVGLSSVLAAAALLCALIALVAIATPFPAPKQAQGWPLAGMQRFLQLPIVLAMAFLLFFESGNEFMLGGYFSTFLTRELAVDVAPASYLLAGYWAAIMAARLVLSRIVLHLGAHPVVFWGAVSAAVGALAVALANGVPTAVAGILVTGFALAGIFPTVLGIAGAAFPEHSGTVFGILFTVALTGGTLLPSLAGRLAASSGLRAVFVLITIDFVVVAVLNQVTRRARSPR